MAPMSEINGEASRRPKLAPVRCSHYCFFSQGTFGQQMRSCPWSVPTYAMQHWCHVATFAHSLHLCYSNPCTHTMLPAFVLCCNTPYLYCTVAPTPSAFLHLHLAILPIPHPLHSIALTWLACLQTAYRKACSDWDLQLAIGLSNHVVININHFTQYFISNLSGMFTKMIMYMLCKCPLFLANFIYSIKYIQTHPDAYSKLQHSVMF